MSVAADTKACTKCEKVKSPGEFRPKRSSCKECDREYWRKWQQENFDQVQPVIRKKVRSINRQHQSRSLENVTRYHDEWTGPEIELALNADLTAARVAELTGRTHAAVNNFRTRIRRSIAAREAEQQAGVES